MAEIERVEVKAYMAQVDVNGKDLTSYVADVDYNASKQIDVTDGDGNVLKTLANELSNIADVNLTTPANGDVLSYDSNADEWVNTAGGGLQPYTGTSFGIGQWYESSNTYIPDMYFNQDSRWSQDESWFRCLTPYITYVDSNGVAYEGRLQSDNTKVEYMPGSWINGEMMGGLYWAINSGLNLKSTAYYSIHNAPDKLVEVTLELTAGAITTNTAKIVSAGNDLPYIVLGDFTSGTYTPVAGATILANADKTKVPVITMNGTTFVIPVAESNATSSSVPIMDKSLATLLKQASDGTLVDPCSCMVAFIAPGNVWYRVQLIFFNNDIQTNQGTQV